MNHLVSLTYLTTFNLHHTHIGAAWPMFAIIFAQFTSVFGDPTVNFMANVNQVALYFLYLSLAACAAAFLQVPLFSFPNPILTLTLPLLLPGLHVDVDWTQANLQDPTALPPSSAQAECRVL